jgi:hypothetical protein
MLGRFKKTRRLMAAGELGPAGGEIATSMAQLADVFVTGSAAEGHHFDYAIENASRLDPLVDLFTRERPPNDVVHSMVLSMGAYVGELMVRNGLGRWIYERAQGVPAVELTSGLVCFPLNKVGKRITVGAEHSIAQFVAAARSGVVPAGAQRVDPQHR